ncbi:head GIN domain-containing protein [Spongiivirga citrea]|uniref:DUF2807 domain-containing protein n=1 Tax=Spongiivirga citrea TaxID=1481457 RepID=A0A6M0CPF3_9FLAO|nr:head GIN domain-containing protein [Spongiivirga citrea]NER18813.1 DUF2807 domain-containing protein [Spongiivirga citrea]
MRKTIYLFVIAVFTFACNNEDANDCFQTTGDIVRQEFTVADFSRILVNENVTLVLKDEPTAKVVIETGKNLLSDITAEVVDGQLILSDNNGCNTFRSFGTTIAYVSAPNITELRTASQYEIRSDGILTYPSIRLISEDFNFPDSVTIGDFRLEVDNQSVTLVFNNLSNCFISGSTQSLNIQYVAGNGRFEGKDLLANAVNVNHRGSNDIIINPQVSLTGTIRSVGNVISYNRPETIEVDEIFNGRLIFRED